MFCSSLGMISYQVDTLYKFKEQQCSQLTWILLNRPKNVLMIYIKMARQYENPLLENTL